MKEEVGINKSPLIIKIQNLMPTMSKTERTVTEYIVKHPDEVIYLTIAALSEKVCVSEPTIVRACKRLGFSGYQSLKIALAQDIVKPMEFVHEKISSEDDIKSIVSKVFSGNIQTLKATQEALVYDDIEAAAKEIMNAESVHIFGIGGSGAIAQDLHHKLIRLGIKSDVYTDAHLQAICAAYAKASDVVFAISHSGSSKIIVDNARRAMENGAKIITLTSLGRSPLSKLADISIFTVSAETKYRMVALSSRLAALSIIDTIYTYIAMQSDGVKTMLVEKAMEEFKY
ncbi:MAG: MurR/RpiR family transcriptional regulator [Pyramidobacter sp.]|nr:MurR/RpiR family transcriptional regulator [Pyramidobacter sp.]